MEAATETKTFTRTHDGRLVHPAGSALPAWAHGWTQCDNRGGGYSTWLDAVDQDRSKADYETIEAAAKKLRSRSACEAALRDLGVSPGGSCKAMRLMYQIVAYADLWPLRQIG